MRLVSSQPCVCRSRKDPSVRVGSLRDRHTDGCEEIRARQTQVLCGGGGGMFRREHFEI